MLKYIHNFETIRFHFRGISEGSWVNLMLMAFKGLFKNFVKQNTHI